MRSLLYVDRDEENKRQGGGIPFCDDSSKCIIFKPRIGGYSYEKAPIVLELPKNLGKYAVITGLVTIGKVRSIKIFVDEAVFDKGSGGIEKFLSIFSVSGTKKESSLLSLSAINDRPIPIARLDFSLDENDTDVTYVRVEDKILNDKYIKEKFDAYKVALKGEQASGVEEEEAKKLQEGLDWLEKGYEGDKLAIGELEKEITAELNKLQNWKAAVDAESIEAEDLIRSQAHTQVTTVLAEAAITVGSAKLVYETRKQEIVAVIAELTKQSVTNRDEYLKYVYKEILGGLIASTKTDYLEHVDLSTYSEIKRKGSPTYSGLNTAYNAVEIAMTAGPAAVGHTTFSAGIEELKKLLGETPEAFSVKVIDELAIGELEKEITAELNKLQNWKAAVDAESIEAEDLIRSQAHTQVTTVLAEAAITAGSAKLVYETRKQEIVAVIAELTKQSVTNRDEYLKYVYKEILGGLIASTKTDYLEHVDLSTYSEIKRKGSPTYSGLNTAYDAAEIAMTAGPAAVGHTTFSAGIVELKKLLGETPEAFSVKVIDELAIGELEKEITAELNKLQNWKAAVDAESIEAEDLIRSQAHTQVTTVLAEAAITAGSAKLVYETRKQEIVAVIAELTKQSVTNRDEYLKYVYKEILGGLIASTKTDYLEHVDLSTYSEIKRKGSPTYSGLNTAYDAAEIAMTVGPAAVGHTTFSAGIEELKKLLGETPEAFSVKVIDELQAIGELEKEITAELNKLQNWKAAVDAESIEAEDLIRSQAHTQVTTVLAEAAITTGSAKLVYETRKQEIVAVIAELTKQSVTNRDEYLKYVYKEILGGLIASTKTDYLEHVDLSTYSEIKRKGSPTYSGLNTAYDAAEIAMTAGPAAVGHTTFSAGIVELKKLLGETPEAFSVKVIDELAIGELEKEITAELNKLQNWKAAVDAESIEAEDLIRSQAHTQVTTVLAEAAITAGSTKLVYETRKQEIVAVIAELTKQSVTNRDEYLKYVYKEILGGLIASTKTDYLEHVDLSTYSEIKRKGSPTYSGLNTAYDAAEIAMTAGPAAVGHTTFSAGIEELKKLLGETPEAFSVKVIDELAIGELEKEITAELNKLQNWKAAVDAESIEAEDLIRSQAHTQVTTVLAEAAITAGSAKLVYETRKQEIVAVIAELTKQSVTNRDEYLKYVYKEILGGLIASTKTDYLEHVDLSTYSEIKRKGSPTYSGLNTAYNAVEIAMTAGPAAVGHTTFSAGIEELKKLLGETPEAFSVKVIDELAIGELEKEITAELNKLQNWKAAVDAESIEAEDLIRSQAHTQVTTVLAEAAITAGSAKLVYETRKQEIVAVIAELTKQSVTNRDEYLKYVYKEILGGLIASTKTDYLEHVDLSTYSEIKRKGSPTYSGLNTAYDAAEIAMTAGPAAVGHTTFSAGIEELKKLLGETPEAFSVKVIDELQAIGELEKEITAELNKLQNWKAAVDAESIEAEDLIRSQAHTQVTTVLAEAAITAGSAKLVYETRKQEIVAVIAELTKQSVTNRDEYLKYVYKEILGGLIASTKTDYLEHVDLSTYSEIKRKGSPTYSGLNTAYDAAEIAMTAGPAAVGHTTFSAGIEELKKLLGETPEAFSVKVIDELAIGELEKEITAELNKLQNWKAAVDAESIEAEDLIRSQAHTQVTTVLAEAAITAGSAKLVYETRKQEIVAVIAELTKQSVTNRDEYLKYVYKEILGGLIASTKTDYLEHVDLSTYSEIKRKGSPTYSGLNTAYDAAEIAMTAGPAAVGHTTFSAGIEELKKLLGETPEAFSVKVIDELQAIGELEKEITAELNKLQNWKAAVDAESIEAEDLIRSQAHTQVTTVLAEAAITAGSAKLVYETRKQEIVAVIAELTKQSVTNRDEYLKYVYKEILGGLIASTKTDYLEHVDLSTYSEIKRKGSPTYSGLNTAYDAAEIAMTAGPAAVGHTTFSAGIEELKKLLGETPEAFSVKVIDELAIGELEKEITAELNKLQNWKAAVDAESIEAEDLIRSQAHTQVTTVLAEAAITAGSAKLVYETRKQEIVAVIAELTKQSVTNRDEYLKYVYKEILGGLIASTKTDYLEHVDLSTYSEIKRKGSPTYSGLNTAYDAAEIAMTAGPAAVGHTTFSAGIEELKKLLGETPEAFSVKVIDELAIGELEKEITAELNKLQNWKAAVDAESIEAEDLIRSQAHTQVTTVLAEAAITVGSAKLVYETRKQEIVAVIAELTKQSVTNRDEYLKYVYKEILGGLIASTKTDYLEHVDLSTYSEIKRKGSPTYSGLNTAYDAAEIAMTAGPAAVGHTTFSAGIEELKKLLGETPEAFSVKVIDELAIGELEKEITAELNKLQNWKAAVDAESIEAEDLIRSQAHTQVTTVLAEAAITVGSAKLVYETRKQEIVAVIAELTKQSVTNRDEYLKYVYKEILGGLIASTKTDYLEHVDLSTYSEIKRKGSPTYSGLNTAYDAAEIAMTAGPAAVGHTTFSAGIEELKKLLGETPEAFSVKVIDELGAAQDFTSYINNIKNNYIFNATIENAYNDPADRLVSKSYRELKEAVDVADTVYAGKRYKEGHKVLKAVVAAMNLTDASALLTTMRGEILGVRLDEKIAFLNSWMNLVVTEVPKGRNRKLSRTNKDVKDFLRTKNKPKFTKYFKSRVKLYTDFIANMAKVGITSADTFVLKVREEILDALLESTRTDYIENATILAKYATEQGRKLSLNYKKLNKKYKKALNFKTQGKYKEGCVKLKAGIRVLDKRGIKAPDKFAKKVIEEIEAAVLSGKVITKSEGVVDYIVSSFYSFIDRLIESRDKIKNTDRETVKVFQGNVAGGNDLGLDLDVLKEEASWGNFSRFKVFVEAGGLEDLPGFAVDFRYTQKDAGLKLSCENSSFMTNRGINLGDFKTTDMYNCDLSWVKKPAVGNIKFRVKGVNIAAADEYKFINAFMTNDFLFSSDKVESSKVKHMPVIDVEIVVLDTASFNAKCRKIGCNVAPEEVGVGI